MDKRIKPVLQVDKAFRLFICVVSIMYSKSHEPAGDFRGVFLGKSNEVYILILGAQKICISGDLGQGFSKK